MWENAGLFHFESQAIWPTPWKTFVVINSVWKTCNHDLHAGVELSPIRQTEPSTSRFGKTSVPLTFKLQESDYSSFKPEPPELIFHQKFNPFCFSPEG